MTQSIKKTVLKKKTIQSGEAQKAQKTQKAQKVQKTQKVQREKNEATIQRTRKKKEVVTVQKRRRLFPFLFVSAAVVLLLLSGVCPVQAADIYFSDGKVVSPAVYASSADLPSGCVLFIIDGLGAAYIYPDRDGEMLDGNATGTASMPLFSSLQEKGFRAVDVSLVNPVTEKGHSTIVTGYSNADSETVGFAGSSVQDVFRENGFLCFGVMTRGDFETMRRKFDAVVYDPSNSVTNAEMAVDRSTSFSRTKEQEEIVEEVTQLMIRRAGEAPSYVSSKTTAERYDGYNRWGIDTASDVVGLMKKYPDQKYLLIVNIGAIDSTGHNRGYFAYLDALERLDDDLAAFASECLRNGAAFVLTADHGMTFAAADKKGGHSSSAYKKCETSLRIPLVILAPGVPPAVYEPKAAQKDIGPTVLSLFDITDRLRYADGKPLPVRKTSSLTVRGVSGTDIVLETSSGKILYSSAASGGNTDDTYRFFGLPKGDYVIRYEKKGLFGGTETQEIFLEADTDLRLQKTGQKTGNEGAGGSGGSSAQETGSDPAGNPSSEKAFSFYLRPAVCLVLLIAVNGGGLLIIRKIIRAGGKTGNGRRNLKKRKNRVNRSVPDIRKQRHPSGQRMQEESVVFTFPEDER